MKEEKHKKCRVQNTEPDLDNESGGSSPAPRGNSLCLPWCLLHVRYTADVETSGSIADLSREWVPSIKTLTPK
jgi:hypothetical protein